MCGIIGYIGKHDATPIILDGLKNLEYRGYDSVGMAALSKGKLIVKKDVGKVEEVAEKLNFLGVSSNLTIGHTRWATHGSVTQVNAHPHLSNDKSIAVVHNGIIENYQKLKRFLEERGFKFYSQTDTEVIPNLVQYWMDNGLSFEEACVKTFKSLDGSYAVLILHKDKKEMVAARKYSPLVLGIADHGFFAASDIPAFLKYTKKVVYLQEGDVVYLTPDKAKIFNLNDKSYVDRKVTQVKWDYNQAKKGNFNHYMLKEILEQVETIKKVGSQDPVLLSKVSEEIKKAKRIWFVAAGTSYHACITGSYIFSKVANILPNVVLASEFPNFSSLLDEKDLIFAVSQSGETADVLQAVRLAKTKGSKVISIVNVIGSTLTRLSDLVVPMQAGPEIGVAATKTYTAEVVILMLIAYALMNKLEEGKKELKYVWNIIYNLTAETTRKVIAELAKKLKDKQHIFLIGRGLDYATALEAALKIKEISYIHAEAFAGGELKHGTIALIEKGTPCIVFVSKENRELIVSNAMEIKSRGGYIIGVSPENNKIFDFWIRVPDNGVLNPVCQIIPMQLLAYKLAVLRGLDPDKPRNLAKSVTVI